MVFVPVSRHLVCDRSGSVSKYCGYAGKCSSLGITKAEVVERIVPVVKCVVIMTLRDSLKAEW